MRTIALFLLIFFTAFDVSAQSGAKDNINSQFNQKDLDDMVIHGQLALFTGMDLNTVNPRLQSFLDKELNMAVVESEAQYDFSKDIKTIIEPYQKRIEKGAKSKKINIKYYLVLDKKENLIVDKCEIYGDIDHIIDVYLLYWPSKLKAGDFSKGELTHCIMVGDRIAYTPDISKGTAMVSITKNTD